MGISGCDVSSDYHYLLLLAQVSIHHHNLVLLVQESISQSIDPSSLPTTASSSIEPSSIPTAASPSIDQSLLSQISSPASASVAVPSGTIQFLDLPSATTAPAYVAMPAAQTRSSSWNSSVHRPAVLLLPLQCLLSLLEPGPELSLQSVRFIDLSQATSVRLLQHMLQYRLPLPKSLSSICYNACCLYKVQQVEQSSSYIYRSPSVLILLQSGVPTAPRCCSACCLNHCQG